MEKSPDRGRGRPKVDDLALAITSEGQRLLVARPEDVATIAKMVDATPQAVSWWRAGGRKPRPEVARRLFSALAIPVDAWTRPPGPAIEAPKAPPEAPAKATARPTSLEEVETMLDELRRAPENLAEAEKQKRTEQRVKLLALKSRIEHQDALKEDAIVRAHPQWAAIKVVLRETLCPTCLEAVRAKLAALRAWEDATRELEEPSEEAAP